MALHRLAGRGGERRELRQRQHHMRRQRPLGLCRALRLHQRILQGERHRPVRRVQLRSRIQRGGSSRRTRWGPGRAVSDYSTPRAPAPYRIAERSAVSRRDAGAHRMQRVDLHLTGQLRRGERPLHMGGNADILPGNVGPRGHRRGGRSDRQVRGIMHQVQRARDLGTQWAGAGRELVAMRRAGRPASHGC